MVEWKKLKEIVTFERGRALSKNDLGVGDAPIILYGELYTTYGDYINNIVSVTLQERARSATLLFYGDIVLPVSSTTKEAQIGKASVIKTKGRVSLGSDAIILRNCQNASYLMYYLNSSLFERDKMSCVSGTTIMHLSPTKLAEKTIPIPSLEEQNRIVGILDTFTSAIDNLKEQIAQRRKQYEYYRDQLLDLEGKPGVEMNNVAHFVKERILANELTAHNYTSVENLLKDKAGRKDAENVPSEGNWTRYQKGDVLIGNIRPYLRKIWLSDREGGTNGDVIVIRPNDKLLPEFMFYCLASESFFLFYNQALKDGKMPRGEKKRVLSYVIPSVGKEEQQHIVSILDTFEASIQNLEAQLKEREKQYEYYRNKLLTFE